MVDKICNKKCSTVASILYVYGMAAFHTAVFLYVDYYANWCVAGI